MNTDSRLAAVGHAIDRWLPRAIDTCFGGFTAGVLALHVLRPDDPWTTYLSVYTVGPYRTLMLAALWAGGLGSVALAVAIHRRMEPTFYSALTSALVLCGGFTTCFLAIFPADIDILRHASTMTPSGEVHNTLALLRFAAGMLAAATWPMAVQRDPGHRHLRSLARVGAVVTLLGFAVWVGLLASYVGLGQRVCVVVTVGWAWIVGRTLGPAAPATISAAG
jgi:hypothetical protein